MRMARAVREPLRSGTTGPEHEGTAKAGGPRLARGPSEDSRLGRYGGTARRALLGRVRRGNASGLALRWKAGRRQEGKGRLGHGNPPVGGGVAQGRKPALREVEILRRTAVLRWVGGAQEAAAVQPEHLQALERRAARMMAAVPGIPDGQDPEQQRADQHHWLS